MKRKLIFPLTITVQLFFLQNLNPCSCSFFPHSFCESVSLEEKLVLAKRVAYAGDNMYFKILHGLNNDLAGDTVLVYGHDGINCLSEVVFPIDTVLMGLRTLNDEEYDLYGCGKYFCWYYNDTLVNRVAPEIEKMAYADFINFVDECISIRQLIEVDGRIIHWKTNQGIAQLPFILNGDSISTSSSGYFQYTNLEFLGRDSVHNIEPKSNHGFSNGITTLDLIQIKKHILGLESFTNPEQWIAADVNQSESITMQDVNILRMAIIGVIDSFPSVDSWRFIDSRYIYPNPNNPWQESIPEVIEMVLPNDYYFQEHPIEFKGVKLGDVNGSY